MSQYLASDQLRIETHLLSLKGITPTICAAQLKTSPRWAAHLLDDLWRHGRAARDLGDDEDEISYFLPLPNMPPESPEAYGRGSRRERCFLSERPIARRYERLGGSQSE